MQSRWDFILEEFYWVREAELRNHFEGMLLKSIFTQQDCWFFLLLVSSDVALRQKKKKKKSTNMSGTISKARTRVLEFLVVFGR